MNAYTRVLTIGVLACVGTGVFAQSYDAAQTCTPPPLPQFQEEPDDVVPFYNDLKPHGVWMQVAPFGFVWRPYTAMTSPAWRPYCDGGQWVWVNNTWCWQSEYAWGSIPFHYGRWMLSRTLGWVWVPGREWSAGWVSWRDTSTEHRWAPLPVDRAYDNGPAYGFNFALTDEHYVSMPRRDTAGTTRFSFTVCNPRPAPVVVYCPPPRRPLPPPSIRHDARNWDQRPNPRIAPPRTGPEDHEQPRIVRPPPARPARRNEVDRSATDRRTGRIQDIISRSRK